MLHYQFYYVTKLHLGFFSKDLLRFMMKHLLHYEQWSQIVFVIEKEEFRY